MEGNGGEKYGHPHSGEEQQGHRQGHRVGDWDNQTGRRYFGNPNSHRQPYPDSRPVLTRLCRNNGSGGGGNGENRQASKRQHSNYLSQNTGAGNGHVVFSRTSYSYGDPRVTRDITAAVYDIVTPPTVAGYFGVGGEEQQHYNYDDQQCVLDQDWRSNGKKVARQQEFVQEASTIFASDENDSRASASTGSTVALLESEGRSAWEMMEVPEKDFFAEGMRCSWCYKYPSGESGGPWVCDVRHQICDNCIGITLSKVQVPVPNRVTQCPMQLLSRGDGQLFACNAPIHPNTSPFMSLLLQCSRFACPFGCGESGSGAEIRTHANSCKGRATAVECFASVCGKLLNINEYVGHLQSIHNTVVVQACSVQVNIAYPPSQTVTDLAEIVTLFECFGEKFVLVKQEAYLKCTFFCMILNSEPEVALKYQIQLDTQLGGTSINNVTGEVFTMRNTIKDLILRGGCTAISKEPIVLSLVTSSGNNSGQFWPLDVHIINKSAAHVAAQRPYVIVNSRLNQSYAKQLPKLLSAPPRAYHQVQGNTKNVGSAVTFENKTTHNTPRLRTESSPSVMEAQQLRSTHIPAAPQVKSGSGHVVDLKHVLSDDVVGRDQVDKGKNTKTVTGPAKVSVQQGSKPSFDRKPDQAKYIPPMTTIKTVPTSVLTEIPSSKKPYPSGSANGAKTVEVKEVFKNAGVRNTGAVVTKVANTEGRDTYILPNKREGGAGALEARSKQTTASSAAAVSNQTKAPSPALACGSIPPVSAVLSGRPVAVVSVTPVDKPTATMPITPGTKPTPASSTVTVKQVNMEPVKHPLAPATPVRNETEQQGKSTLVSPMEPPVQMEAKKVAAANVRPDPATMTREQKLNRISFLRSKMDAEAKVREEEEKTRLQRQRLCPSHKPILDMLDAEQKQKAESLKRTLDALPEWKMHHPNLAA